MSKKLFPLFLVVIFSMLLAACGGAAATTAAPAVEEPAAQATEAPAAEEPAPATEAPAAEEPAASGEKVQLVINSWRNDDITIWQDTLIPAFNAHYPDIEVVFAPDPPADYNAALNAKLEGGSAGDLITCRPFDASLALFDQGHLAPLNDLPGMENFSEVAKSAWTTDDGSTTFCVPMASVIHGFIYNQAIFEELGLEEPTTVAEFHAVLDAIKEDGQYTPLVMGTVDQWEAATMGFQNIGPNYWKGEEGRKGLIAGTEKYTDPQYVAVWEELASWGPYLGEGYKAQTYPDSQNLFTLGQGAIFPAGSWEISVFRAQADFEMGAFPPPVVNEGDTLYISDHTDIAMGMNANSAHPEEARAFLEWMTTPEFAELYTNALPGFFSLSNHTVEVEDPLAAEFVGWRESAEETIRNSYAILSRGEPNLENELWRITAQVMNGDITPADAAAEIQAGLESWYTPGE